MTTVRAKRNDRTQTVQKNISNFYSGIMLYGGGGKMMEEIPKAGHGYVRLFAPWANKSARKSGFSGQKRGHKLHKIIFLIRF